MTISDQGANTCHARLPDTPVHASFLVTSYNKVAYLPAVLASVWHEAVAIGGEVILVDDGSTDGSVQVCEAFVQAHPAVRYWRQENRGIYATVNDIAAKARGKWVRFCDSDDPLIAGSTRRLIEVAERSGAGVVYGQPIYYGPEPMPEVQILQRSGPDGLSSVHADGMMHLIRGMNFTPSMTIYRRETLAYALPLPTNLVSCQDLALLLPIIRHTALAWVDEPVCYNLKGASNQLSANYTLTLQQTLRITQRNADLLLPHHKCAVLTKTANRTRRWLRKVRPDRNTFGQQAWLLGVTALARLGLLDFSTTLDKIATIYERDLLPILQGRVKPF